MRAQKGWAAIAAALVVAAVQAANLAVTNVKVAQRYPWNGLVDITYTVNCDDPTKNVWVYPVGYDADTDTSVALMPEFLSGAGASNAVHNGTHQMTWNMAQQMGKGYNRAAFSVKLHAYCDAAPYMVVDLSAGSEAEKYPVTYLSEIPEGGWTDEYKTTKMVFRLILPGTFWMGSPTSEEHHNCRYAYDSNRVWDLGANEYYRKVSITQPFYCAIFEMTENQYVLIAGGTSTSKMPKGNISYNELRGTLLGAQWPSHQQVDASSILGKLRLKTGITIDIPTEAQWEYACRAGSQGTVNVPGATLASVAWCSTSGKRDVGLLRPNAFGLYDTLGNVAEWCRDWLSDDSGTIDPVGGSSSTYEGKRAIRGGAYRSLGGSYDRRDSAISACRPAARFYRGIDWIDGKSASFTAVGNPSDVDDAIGCRFVALPVCK